MPESIHRRTFLGSAAATGALLGTGSLLAADSSPSKRLVVGVMGVGGRGTEHCRTFARQAGVTVAYVCDVDAKRMNTAAGEVEKAAGKAPQAVQDFRKILDDKAV